MQKRFLSILLLFFSAFSYGQTTEIKRISMQVNTADLDAMGNLIVLDNRSVIRYISAEDFEEKFNYSLPQQGIGKIDASNPFRTVAFSESNQEIYLLNNRLSPISNFQLPTDFFVTQVCINNQSQLWLLDQIAQTLWLYDPNSKQILQEIRLQETVPDSEHGDLKLYQNGLYLSSSDHAVQHFDVMGNLIRTLNVKTANIGFEKDMLYYLSDNQLIFLPLYVGKKEIISLPSASYRFVLCKEDLIYAFSNTEIIILRKNAGDGVSE
ncbi:hypothetical protein [Sediminitomix flava]|nr:hypothetical protein [Sediminitomix flava]